MNPWFFLIGSLAVFLRGNRESGRDRVHRKVQKSGAISPVRATAAAERKGINDASGVRSKRRRASASCFRSAQRLDHHHAGERELSHEGRSGSDGKDSTVSLAHLRRETAKRNPEHWIFLTDIGPATLSAEVLSPVSRMPGKALGNPPHRTRIRQPRRASAKSSPKGRPNIRDP